MDKLRVAVIGAGRIGRLHAENLAFGLSGVELVAVVDPMMEAAQACGARLGVKAYTDAGPVLEDPNIHAVLIGSSTDTHAALIVQAAQAGKHIFCEKPIALDLKAIDRAIDAVEAAGVVLHVGFNRRYDPSFRRAQEVVASGGVGKPHLLRITSRDPGPPPLNYIRASGGLFLDMTIHDFDMARYLMAGDEVEEVYANGAVLVDPLIGQAGDIDTAAVTLRFRSGAIGVIDNSRRATYGYDQRAEVLGDLGAVAVENPRLTNTVVSTTLGDARPPLLNFFVERYKESYIAEMQAFLDCLRQGSPSPVSGQEGKIPVVMAFAAMRSVKEGRPVRLDEIDPTL